MVLVMTSLEIADLQAAADRFQALTPSPEQGATEAFRRTIAEAGRQDRLERVADALTAGSPGDSVDLVAEVAAEIDLESTPDPPPLEPLVYWSALSIRILRPDLEEIVADLDERLRSGEGPDGHTWDTADGELYLQSLACALLPLAGLDLAGATHYARVFMDNFPPFSLPLGDVDERATRWLAQLLDMGNIRATLRQTLRELAGAWEEAYPQAAAQIRAWAEAPMPSDQTRDLPWVQALLPLARTQVHR